MGNMAILLFVFYEPSLMDKDKMQKVLLVLMIFMFFYFHFSVLVLLFVLVVSIWVSNRKVGFMVMSLLASGSQIDMIRVWA